MRLKSYFAGLSRNTYLLALASLFADVSTEVLYPILPVFLTQNLGATATVLGPLVALALIALAAVSLPSIFLLAFVPGLLATLMILMVREKPIDAHAKAKLDVHLDRFPRRYWAYLGVTALFGIGNSSNAFLILRTHDLGASLTLTILIYALFNLVAALASYPAGYLSDHFGRKTVLLFAFVIFLIVYAGFGF